MTVGRTQQDHDDRMPQLADAAAGVAAAVDRSVLLPGSTEWVGSG